MLTIVMRQSHRDMRIRGYAATWNRPFWPAGSIVPVVLRPGAFAAQLAATGVGRVRVLMYHDTTRPVGRVDTLREDERGLYFEAALSDTRDGRDAAVLVGDGTISEASIGFSPIEYGQDAPVIISSAELYEVSLVTWGANPDTRVELVAGPEGETRRAIDRRKAVAKAKEIALRWRWMHDCARVIDTAIGAPR